MFHTRVSRLAIECTELACGKRINPSRRKASEQVQNSETLDASTIAHRRPSNSLALSNRSNESPSNWIACRSRGIFPIFVSFRFV